MNRVITSMALAAVALTLGAPGYSQNVQQSKDEAQREQEYLAALKKCEPLGGAEKERCIEAAKKKLGQM